jgi:protocatechuate 3,4-dioxygenase beta subunit
MERRAFLVALPAIAVALRTEPVHAAPQDLEFVRAWERAQQLRPRILSSRARIAPVGEPGTPMIIAGRLFARDGRQPAPDVTVFAYHTDANGIYDERSKGPHSWRLKGWAVTNAEGRFEFETNRPAPYPGRTTAAHVHLSLEGRGLQRRWTGLMFEDDPLVPADERAKSAKAGQFGSVRPVVMRNGVEHVDLPIKITDEGVF